MGIDEKKEEEKGFVVRDRRFSSQKEKEEESGSKAEEKREEPHRTDTAQRDAPLPEIDFANFIHSLYISALIQMGEIPDPVTKQPVKELALAKQTIDLISMLQGKTKGNLTPEEGKLIEDILYNLRLIFVKATK
jgi:hypothetical protein